MQIKIKCDKMPIGWDYGGYSICSTCKHFRLNIYNLKNRWRCKLNNGSADERRAFHSIWLYDMAIARGIMSEEFRDEIIVVYIGKV